MQQSTNNAHELNNTQLTVQIKIKCKSTVNSVNSVIMITKKYHYMSVQWNTRVARYFTVTIHVVQATASWLAKLGMLQQAYCS